MTNSDKPTAGCGGGAAMDALLIRAQAMVDRKYIARADARQKSMGLAYVEAERQDLAREIARFVEQNTLPQASAPRSASAGDGVREALERVIKANDEFRASLPDGWEGDPLNDACIEAKAALASNPLEGKGIQSTTEQASSGLRSTKQREG